MELPGRLHSILRDDDERGKGTHRHAGEREDSDNALLLCIALSGAMAVAAGAFGAHGAQGQAAEWLRLGAQYQLVHAVAALAVAQLGARGPSWPFVAGAALFAGTLYLMALGLPRWLGAVTPVGGALLIAGWLWLAWIGVRERSAGD